jgi:hypothetical protein
MNIKQVYIPIVKVTFEYFADETMLEAKTIKIVSAGGHKFPVCKSFGEESIVYDLFKYNGKLAVYRNKKAKQKYVVWGISRHDATFDKTIGEQIHTYEWADPIFLSSAHRDDIEHVSPIDPHHESIKSKLWSAYDFTPFKPDVWTSKFFQYQDKIRIKEEEDYKRKQEKYANENRAICGACERYIERWDEGSWNGVIYDHGFKQEGYRAGTCIGSRLQVWEKSTEGKVALINMLQSRKDGLLNAKPDQKKLDGLLLEGEKYIEYKERAEQLSKEYGDEHERYRRERDFRDRYLPFNSWLMEHKNITVVKRESVQYFGLHVWANTTVNDLLKVWQAEIDRLTVIIEREQEKVDNWALALTARERRDAK